MHLASFLNTRIWVSDSTVVKVDEETLPELDLNSATERVLGSGGNGIKMKGIFDGASRVG